VCELVLACVIERKYGYVRKGLKKCLLGVIEKVCVSASVRACVSVREREKERAAYEN